MSAPGPDSSLEVLERRCAEIAERLNEAASPESREEVKREILALFREVSALRERVDELRERVRGLAEAYRSGGGEANRGRRGRVHSDGLNSSSFVERGWNLIAAGKPAEAVGALEKALGLSPDNLDAEGLLGWALILCERYDRALVCLRRVLLADPSNEMARVNLGLLCLKRRIHGEALEHLTRALELGRDRKARLYALHYLGLLHAERGDVEAALACFGRALEEGPNLIEAAYHMGLLLYRQGRIDRAREVWEEAVARNRFNPYSKKAKALLEELEAGRPIAAS